MSLPENKNIIENLVVVLLCAGEGRRMKKITSKIPKPLLKIPSLNNKPILEINLENLKKLGIKDIFIVVGHLGNKIEEYILSTTKKVQLIHSKEEYKKGPLNTFLEVLNSQKFHSKISEINKKKYILVIPGDTIFELELLNDILELINRFQITIDVNPLIFYRILKNYFYNNQNKLNRNKRLRKITRVIIQKHEPFPFLKKIIQENIKNSNPKSNILQIIPIILFPKIFTKKILELEPFIQERTIRALLNYAISKGEIINALEIVSECDFFDIDEGDDIEYIKKKRKDNSNSMI